jgi:hypothetical protein
VLRIIEFLAEMLPNELSLVISEVPFSHFSDPLFFSYRWWILCYFVWIRRRLKRRDFQTHFRRFKGTFFAFFHIYSRFKVPHALILQQHAADCSRNEEWTDYCV